MSRYRKSWTQVLQEVYLGEALKPIDKSVVDAFYYKKEKAGKIVSTDGDTLTKMGIGGQQIAKWVGRKIKITAVSDVKSTESIIKYMKKSIPTGNFKEAYSFSMFIEDHECPKCNGKGCEHCDDKGYHEATLGKGRLLTKKEREGLDKDDEDPNQTPSGHSKKPSKNENSHDTEFDVKTAKSKMGKITVKSFDSLDDAKKHLEAMKKKGHNGLISKGGKPVKEETEINEISMEAGKVYHQDSSDGKMYFKAVEQQRNKRWKGLVLDIGQKKPKNGSADESLRFWKATPDKDIPAALKEETELESMTEEIHQLEERRQSYSNFIPFPEKILTDFAKRALKAGLTFAQYMKYVKGTFKDGADSNNAIIFGRDVYKKKKGAVDPDAWSLKREEVVVEREMTDAEKDKREEIVLSLKKKTKDFKERYGDKWKEVMYATATKMAMGESEEEPKSKKKDKINLKPKMDETMKTYKDLIKGLKESNPKPQTEETSIKEGVTEQGVEYGEQDWDLESRPDALYPNLNVNFAEFMESGLEGPYLFKGEHYFFDRKINGWYSMSSEDYVSEAEAEELHMAYNKHGLTKAQFSN